MIRSYGVDTLGGETPLAAVTDSSLDYLLIRYNQKQYPIGRYAFVDKQVHNGFDYLYVVTAVIENRVPLPEGRFRIERLESPLVTQLDSLARPQQTARSSGTGVWVVPNPYRAKAPWDRPPVPGDVFGRHIDFFGLPRAQSTIKIWTLAGDFVAQIEHDGRQGIGQASWN